MRESVNVRRLRLAACRSATLGAWLVSPKPPIAAPAPKRIGSYMNSRLPMSSGVIGGARSLPGSAGIMESTSLALLAMKSDRLNGWPVLPVTASARPTDGTSCAPVSAVSAVLASHCAPMNAAFGRS